MKKKVVLFLVSSMQGGGAERVAALLCNRWVENGHEVVLMPTFSGRGDCLYPLDERVSLDYLADRVGNTSKSLWNMFRRFLALRRVIIELEPDVIVSFLTHVNVAALMAGVGLNIPLVVSERTNPALFRVSSFWSWGRRLSYRRSRWVVVQTTEVRRWVIKNCPRTRTKVIPNPVVYPLPISEPVLQPKAMISEERRLLLAVGRLGPEKGFDCLLEAFAKLAEKNPEWDLVILGEGVERCALEVKRATLGLAARVHLPGRAGNVGDWYARADLYVLSSRYEGFPNTLLEAMAHGVPAVSMDCATGPADIIRHEVDGLLVSEASGVDGLSQALRRLMQDDERRKTMAVHAKEVRQRYSIERVGALWDYVLE